MGNVANCMGVQKLNGPNGESEWGGSLCRIPIYPMQIHHSLFSFSPMQDPHSDHSVLAMCRLEIKQRNAVQVQDLFKYSLNPLPHNVSILFSHLSSLIGLPILFPGLPAHPLPWSAHSSSSLICPPVLFPHSPLHLENKIVFLNNMMIFNKSEETEVDSKYQLMYPTVFFENMILTECEQITQI